MTHSAESERFGLYGCSILPPWVPPLLPFPVWISTGVHIHTGRGRGSGCVESISRYTLCIWPDSEPTKLLYHPKQKHRRGGGLRQINTCRQVPLLVNFWEKPTFSVKWHYRYLVHGRHKQIIYKAIVLKKKVKKCRKYQYKLKSIHSTNTKLKLYKVSQK